MRFGPVNGVVLPSARLLNTDGTPFVFGEEAGFGESFGQFFGEDYVSVVIFCLGGIKSIKM